VSVTSSKKPENPLWNLVFNIFLPVFILQKASPHLGPDGPLWALLLALCLPIGYGIVDYMKRRHKNYISLIGIVSVLFTGGLAVVQADGIWFAVVEMGLPLILGLGVLASAFSTKPFISTMAYNEMLMQVDHIEAALIEMNTQDKFRHLLKNSTLLLSLSFFLSAALNFALAYSIFTPIDTSLVEIQRTEILNTQIAEMRYKSIFVIMIPLMAFSIGILWHLLNGIKKLSGLKVDQILKAH
jgi:hypothetical protein